MTTKLTSSMSNYCFVRHFTHIIGKYLGTTYVFSFASKFGNCDWITCNKNQTKTLCLQFAFFYDSTDVDVVKKWQENRSAQDFFSLHTNVLLHDSRVCILS